MQACLPCFGLVGLLAYLFWLWFWLDLDIRRDVSECNIGWILACEL